MLAGNNDLNMLLKAQVIKLRAELDVKGSLPKIKKQVDEISTKLKGKPVKLDVKLDYKIGELRKQMNMLQTSLNTAKTLKPIKIKVDIDVRGSATQIKKQLQDIYKIVGDFNKQYGDQMKRMQQQTQQSFKNATNIPHDAMLGGFNAKTYVKQVNEARDMMKSMFGKGDFKAIEFKDAEGNLKGFIGQLEKSNGVVQKIRYEWNKEAGKFMPINQQTINGIEKHVNKASQSLRGLYADIFNLQEGKGQQNLLKEYEELEKRIGRGTLTQDSVRTLQRMIKEEQVLQQVIDKQNKEYINQERLVQKIAKARAKAWLDSSKQGEDINTRKQYSDLISSVRNDGSQENLARTALELDKINSKVKERTRLTKDLEINEKRRVRTLEAIRKIQMNTVSTDATSSKLLREIDLMARRAKSAEDWIKIDRKMSQLRLSNDNDKYIQNMLTSQFKLEQALKDFHRLTNATAREAERDFKRMAGASERGLADVNRMLDETNRKIKQTRAQMKDQAHQSIVTQLDGRNASQRLQFNELRTAIDRDDIETVQKYTGHLLKGRVETVKIEKATDEFGRSVDRMKVRMMGTGKTVKTYVLDLDRVNKQLRQTQQGMDYNANRNLGIMEQLRIAMARVPVWMTAMTAFYGSIRSVQAMTREILEVDRALTELRRVADSSINIDRVFQGAVDLSGQLGNNVHDVMQTMNDFARTFGEFNERQLLAITNTATLMSNVSELNAQEAGETLIATMNAFNIEAEESIRIVDAFNEVDNNFAVSTQQLAEGMSKTASTAKTFGVTMEESVGHITAISSVTMESGKIIGNSLKTIYSRITTLGDAKEVLEGVGIALHDQSGQIRDVQDILSDLGAKWYDLTDAERQNIAVKVAGRYQLSRFLALMNNWDTAIEATGTALTSQGSAFRENQAYMESFEARINQLKNSFTEMALAIGDSFLSGSIMGIIDLLSNLANIAISLSGSIGALPVILGVIGMVMNGMGVFRGSIGSTIAFLKLLGTEFKTASASMGVFRGGLAGTAGALRAFSVLAPTVTAGLRGIGLALKGILASTGVGLIFVGIGVAIEKLIGKYQEQKQAQKDLEQSNDKLVDSYRNTAGGLEALVEKHNSLQLKVDTGQIKEGTEEYNEYLQVNQELADKMPNMVEYIDSKGKAHLKEASALRENVQHAKELSEAYADLTLKEFEKNTKDRIKNIDDLTKKIDKLNKTINKNNELDGTRRVTGTGRAHLGDEKWDLGEEIQKDKIQVIIAQQEIQGEIQKINGMINDTIMASIEANGKLQFMSDTAVSVTEKVITGNEKLLRDIAMNEDLNSKQRQEQLDAKIGELFDIGEKVGMLIAEKTEELVDGVTDPEKIAELKTNFDLLLSVLPDRFISEASLDNLDKFEKNLDGIMELTSKISSGNSGGDIDALAKQFEKYGLSVDEAKKMVIKLGFEHNNQAIKAEAYRQETDGLIDSLDEYIEKTIEAIDASEALFGYSDADMSALKSHLEMLKAMRELGQENTQVWHESVGAIADYYGVTNEYVEKNIESFLELSTLMSEWSPTFDDKGNLEKDAKEKFNRILEIAEELDIEVNIDDKAVDENTKKTEENTEAKKKNEQASKDNATAVDVLNQKFQTFKGEADSTNRAVWIETIKTQLGELDGKIEVTRDEELGGLKLAMSDGSKSEWLNTLQSQLGEIGGDLQLVEDDAGNLKLVLNDGSGSTTLATIKGEAQDTKVAIGEAVKEHDILKETAKSLPNDYSQIDFTQLFSGLDTTAEKVQFLSEALQGVWENTDAVTGLIDTLESIIGKSAQVEDAIKGMFDKTKGTLGDMEAKARDAQKAVEDLSTSISNLNAKSRKITLDPFVGFVKKAKDATKAVDTFKSSFSDIIEKVSGMSSASLIYSASLTTISKATMTTMSLLKTFEQSLTTLATNLAFVTGFNMAVADSQKALATSMSTVVSIIKSYSTSISNAGSSVSSAYAEMAKAIATYTARIISQYDAHGVSVKKLEATTKTAWDSIISAVNSKGRTLVQTITRITNEMHKAFRDGLNDIVRTAEQLPARIGQGVRSNMASASSAMDAVAKDMVSRFKKELGIHSPSRVFEELGGWVIKGLANGLTGSDLKSLGREVFKDFGGGVFDSMDMIKAYVSGDFSDINFNAGAGVQQWAGIASKALMMTGQFNQANLQRLLMQMGTESSGNPRAINLWDSNAKRGTPSKGLMQVIDPTFNAYKMPGFNNIWNPLDNILASIRYTLARYGSLARGWRGVGYEEGGFIEKEHLAMVGEKDKREVVIPLEQHKDRAIDLWEQTGEELGIFNRKRKSSGGIGANILGAFGAFSGEGGSSDSGGAGSGTSGTIQSSTTYIGGVNLDGEYDFMAFAKKSSSKSSSKNKEPLADLYTWDKEERQAQAYEHAISMIEAKMRGLNQTTTSYRNMLKQVISQTQKLLAVEKKDLSQTKARQKAIEKQLKTLSNTGKHTKAQRDKYNKLQQEYAENISKIHNLEKSIQDSTQKIKDTNTEMFIDWVDQIVGKYESSITIIKGLVDDIDFKIDVLSLTDPENAKKEIELLVERARTLGREQATTSNMVKDLQKEYDKAVKKYGKNSKEAKKLKEELDKAQESLEDITLEVLKAEKDIKDARGKIADDAIKQLKDYYSNMKNMAVEAIEIEKRELKKAHDEKMKMYDDEISKINSVYDEKLKAMDKEKAQAEFQEELDERNAKKAELVNKISLLSRDTSLEGRKKVEELRKELGDLDKEIADMMRKRQDELLREAMEEQKQKQIEAVEAEKETEQEAYDGRVEELDKEKSDIEAHYDKILNDEKRWADMRDAYIKGSNKTLINELEAMNKQLAEMSKGNFDSLTKGFKGFSDEVKKEFADMFGLDVDNLIFNSDGMAKEAKDVAGVKYNPYAGKGTDHDNPAFTTWKEPKPKPAPNPKPAPKPAPAPASKPVKVGGKAKVSASNANAYLDSYGRQVRPWSAQAKAAGVNYGSSLYVTNMRGDYVALGKSKNVNSTIAWVRKKDLVGLRTGGYTGDWAGDEGKVAMLHKKELVLNERQTSDILDSAKIMDKVKSILPILKRGNTNDKLATASQITNITYGDINVTVQDGNKKKAKDIAKEIMTEFKKKGK